MQIDAKLEKIRYRLHDHHEPPNRLRREFVEGEGLEAVKGEFSLAEQDGQTEAHYRLGVDPGVPVPALLARRLTGGVMRRVVDDLKRRVEAASG